MTVQGWVDDLIAGKRSLEDTASLFRAHTWAALPEEYDDDLSTDMAPVDPNSWTVVSLDSRLTSEQYRALARAYQESGTAAVVVASASAGNPMNVLANDRGLRRYWTKGAGAAKIRWGTDGSFARCVSQLGKHVKNPQGLCAEYHKEATGEWPAEKGVESSMTNPLVAHGSHNQQDHNPHKDPRIFPRRDGDYSDAFDAPTRAGQVRRMNELEDQAEGDEGLSSAEAAELRKLRKLYGDLRETSPREDMSDYDPEDQKDHGNRRTSKGFDSMTDATEVVSRLKKSGVVNKADAEWTGRADADPDTEVIGIINEWINEETSHDSATGRLQDLGIDPHSIDLDYLATLVEQLRNSGFSAQITAASAKGKQKTFTGDQEWHGILSVEGVESGDGRLFSLGSLDWATLPMPLMYQPANVGGHNASVIAGSIDKIARKGNEIVGWGKVYANMLNGEHGAGIQNMLATGGVSVDVDKVKDADIEQVFAEGDEGGFMSNPEITIFNRGRIRGATLVAFPAFVEAKLSLVGETLTASTGVRCGCDDGDVLVAAGHTITIPNLPPAEWFSEPIDVKMDGALTITDEGRVFGYVAPSNTTHRSVKKRVPMGARVDYSRWMNKETIVAGGGRIKTGVITMNCGHAATSNYGTLQNRKDHYDNTCSVFADVVVGEWPGKGVWFAGAVKHGVTAEQLTAAMACSLSGDWQPHPDRPGVQEFIAALLVPVPGFPMARAKASVTFEDGLITASVVPVRFGAAQPRSDREVAFDMLVASQAMIMESLGIDPDSEKRRIMAEIEGFNV